jgi:formylglycine-generating enzyme required for sulfatase activity
MLLLVLLIIAFAAYRYNGREVLTFFETMIPGGKIITKVPKSLFFKNAPTTGFFLRQHENYTEPATGIGFVFIPGGCYQMGDTFGDGDADEKPVHEVCVDDYYMSRHEVTQGQWEKLMKKNPSSFASGKNYPVEKISRPDIQDFIGMLNKRITPLNPPLSKEGGKGGYRLPTEAEWEYACRSGGKKEKWAGTANEAMLGEYAWTGSNSGGKPHPVGKGKPNGLGLYDMSGNVWEWVEDDYAPDCYQDQDKDNPVCIRGGNRVIRGGNWYLSPRFARCTARSSANPSAGAYSVGFRLVKEK